MSGVGCYSGGVKTDAPFHLDFVLDRKAAINDGEDGEVYVQGFASDFGLDRQDEAFEEGAFQKGMEEFMKNPVILYHHHFDEPLGKITEFENRKEGLWVKGRLDVPEPGTKAADIVRKVRSGTIRGFSVGGKFHRRKGPDGRARIHTADMHEISLTPLPINPRSLAEVAGKAFPDEAPEGDTDLKALVARIAELAEVFERAEKLIEGKAKVSTEKREKAAASGNALPDGSFPINNVEDLKNAIQAFGRAKDKAAAKAHIIKRAKALGKPDLLPEGWL